MKAHLYIAITATGLLFVCGCTVGPKYTKPTAPVPQAFKEEPPKEFSDSPGWKQANPADRIVRGKWWEIFGDPQLNSLEESLTLSNATLKVAEARLRQARTSIRYNRAAQFPTISLTPSIINERLSANQPYITPSIVNNGTGVFTFPIEFSYEVDLWGRIRHSVNSAKEEAQATAGDRETASLSLHAELARDYFELRSADLQMSLLDQTVKAYARALQLTESRYYGGASPRSDLTQAQTQLEAARVQLTDIQERRADFEHAIAVLIDKPPAEFSLTANPDFQLHSPVIPVGLPGALLERRPDVASAERRVAEANEQIGIARTAYFPTVILGASAGFEGTSASNWFNWPSRLWAVGPQVSQTLFDGGRRRATSESAIANYDASVALYRQSALTAFQEVEDNLAALRILETESAQQQKATAAAEESLRLFTRRYKDGVDTYLQVVISETTALQNEVNQIDLSRRQLDASVQLVKAVGGGWDTSQLPKY
jgi:NodT family efflux transporter outer membrane factor (OMF) lipoprotein